MAPDRHPGCPGAPPANVRGAFNAHSPGDGGSGLVQPVFRSPARIPAAETTRKDLCAAPPSEKRYTLRKTLYVIIGDVMALGKGTLPAKPRDGVVPTLEIADLSGKCSGG